MNNQHYYNQQPNYYNSVYGFRNQPRNIRGQPVQRGGYVQQYNIPIFNDIHNYFPAILYEHERFPTVNSLLGYIRDQVRYHSDTFLAAQREYLYGYNTPETMPPMAATQMPMAATAPSATPPTPVTASNIRVTTDQQFLNSLLNIFTQPDLTLMTGIFNLPEPVVVNPSNDILTRASDIMAATADHNGVQCMVCLEHLQEGQELRKLRFCRHVFHRSCIDTWFERTVRCPICRHDIRDDLPTDEDEAEAEAEAERAESEESELNDLD